ncbi:hypothetical protein IQ254_18285 [Nodosilinea sp. LEGE 07088]|uniref:hypothetical protein n=1 Tax=Nodosilinea sp. LEGE 07088 TaxID=2777968 RepID=UPI00188107D6|nr:hypothetical protein [Nodosilinea sp. LEGE 07088]MBE9139119.1 hypothetical protein [Nodosilinea sp. LEGE 07088]
MALSNSVSTRCRLGKVVKSNSHCDYVVQVDDAQDVSSPPSPEDCGFGQFVSFDSDRHWAVGLIYNSQLFNPLFLNTGPRLSSEPDPLFTPDLVQETRTLLGVVLVGAMEKTDDDQACGKQGIPQVVVPANTSVYKMLPEQIHRFHCNDQGQTQFSYYSHLLRSGGMFAAQLAQQVLAELVKSDLFNGADQKALTVLAKELSWKNTLGAIR